MTGVKSAGVFVTGSGQFWLGARADYAIRALAELAVAVRPMTAEEIAEARAIPKSFLTVILSQLVRAGLVNSRRGRIGGYVLALTPEELHIAEVVAAVSERTAGPPPTTKDPYERLRGQLFDVIETVTLADLIEQQVGPVSRTRSHP